MCAPVVLGAAMLASSLLMRPRKQDAPPVAPISKPINQEDDATKPAEIDPGTGDEGIAKDKKRKQLAIGKTSDLKTTKNIGLSIGGGGRQDPTGVNIGKPTAPTP
tara:strand:- start:232 stop:546 length:315 start_codon:yes stop_codon:yes gene_type:complete